MNWLRLNDEWKEEFDQIVPKGLTHVQDDGEINPKKIHTLLDGIIMLDSGYTKFMVDVRNLLDNRWKSHLTNFASAQEFKWPSDLTINKWQEKCLGSNED